MTTLNFRDARPEDIPTLVRLSHEGDARGKDTPPLNPATLADPRYRTAFDEIAADPAHRLIAVQRAGELIGTLQLSFIPGLPNFGMKRGIIENVHIRSDCRGNGHGTEMMQWAIERCREAGCGVVQLTSNKVRTQAHRFYERLGFSKTHEGFKLRF